MRSDENLLIEAIIEDEEDRYGKITQCQSRELWAIHRRKGKVTWGDVYAHILIQRDYYYSKDELDPEE